MLHCVYAPGQFLLSGSPAINPGWKTWSSHGGCQANHQFEALDNGLITFLHLMNGNRYIDVGPHTFCVQTGLDDRKGSMIVQSTPSPTWCPTVYAVRQVQAETCNSNHAWKVGCWGQQAQRGVSHVITAA